MKYLSVCSGIEAATVAWHDIGWKPVAFSEIEPFPSKVLAHHYPDVTNLGDMTKFNEWSFNEPINLLVGGTPCQSFSVAGLRQGLKDPRGNLMLTYLAIADKFKPKWVVWENVPGVLSSNNGRDFAAFLEGLAELGYGWAYRVLDAQYFGVAQRRRRVFVVGCLGSTERAAKVLFEPESVSGNPPPSREKGQEVASGIANGTCSGKPTFGTLMANCGDKQWLGNQEALSGDYHVFALAGNTIGRKPENGGNGNGFDGSGVSYTLTKTDVHGVAYNEGVCGTLNASGAGTNRPAGQGNELDFLAITPYGIGELPHVGHCLRSGASKADKPESTTYLVENMSVRRLTPTECERLQGFPDSYTNIPNASDSPRCKALGNSMAVPVMKWIGERIDCVDRIG